MSNLRHPVVYAQLIREEKRRWQKKASLRVRLLQWMVPISFFLGTLLMLIQIASVAELFQVEVRIKTAENDIVLGKGEGWVPGHSGVAQVKEPQAAISSESDTVTMSSRDREEELVTPELPRVEETLIFRRQGDKLEESTKVNDEAEAGSEDNSRNTDSTNLHGENENSELWGWEDPVDKDSDADIQSQDDLNRRSRNVEIQEFESSVDSDGDEFSILHKGVTSDGGFSERAPIIHARYDGERMMISPQIDLPKRPIVKAYNSDKNFWPWYRVLRKHGWSHVTDSPDIRANMLFSKGAVPYLRKGKQMLNSIGVSGCIGGAKVLQLECRKRLAERFGCDYDDLKVQPVQYSLDTIEGCQAWYANAMKSSNTEKFWLYKPSNTFHGKGIKLFKGPAELYKRVNQCKSTRSVIIMEYIDRPATMHGGYKFDLRSYLLVGSLDPQLVFFADGFVRKSDTIYSLNSTQTTVHVTNSVLQKKENHFFSFDELSEALQKELGFSPEYINHAREYMKKVSVYVFKTTDTQRKPLSRFPGRFHLFAIDWVIDADGGIHLLEGNGYPLVTEYPVQGLTPVVWEDLIDLVLKIHVTPSELGTKMTTKDNFKLGKWSLIYNELEDQWNAAYNDMAAFNPCRMFPDPFQTKNN